MTYVMDTHIFLWLVFDPQKIQKKQLKILENPRNTLLITSISFWEISLKYNLGKLDLNGLLPEDLPSIAQEMGITPTNIDENIMSSFYKLKKNKTHKDPFDRIVIWYCITQKYTLISQDRKFSHYDDLKTV